VGTSLEQAITSVCKVVRKVVHGKCYKTNIRYHLFAKITKQNFSEYIITEVDRVM